MATEGQKTQWPQKDRQRKGHKSTDNTMATKGQSDKQECTKCTT